MTPYLHFMRLETEAYFNTDRRKKNTQSYWLCVFFVSPVLFEKFLYIFIHERNFVYFLDNVPMSTIPFIVT